MEEPGEVTSLKSEDDRTPWLPEEGWLFPLLFSAATTGLCVLAWFLDRAGPA